MTASKGIRSFYRGLELVRKAFIVAIFFFIIGAGAIEIFLRYTPGFHGFSWIDEIMRYLDIWLVFLAASLAVRTDGHMYMDFFIKRALPARFQPAFIRFCRALIVLTLLFFTFISAEKVIATREVMIQAFAVPIALFYLALPLGCLLMAFEYLLLLIYGDHPFRSGAAEEIG